MIERAYLPTEGVSVSVLVDTPLLSLAPPHRQPDDAVHYEVVHVDPKALGRMLLIATEHCYQPPTACYIAEEVLAQVMYHLSAHGVYVRHLRIQPSQHLPYWAFSVQCLGRACLFDLRTGKELL